MKLEMIPAEIRELNHFVGFRLVPDPQSQKTKKVPCNPKTGDKASTTDSETWSDLQTALHAVERFGFDGIGFVLTKELGIIGIDIDHCVDAETGELNDTATAILGMCYTYAEYSPSGTGMHLLMFGQKPDGACKNTETGVEMYDDARYLTLTGNRIEEFPNEINSCEEEIVEIHQRFVAKQPKQPTQTKKRTSKNSVMETAQTIFDEGHSLLSDEELVAKASMAKNGENFQRLYEGDWGSDYSSQSEADMAFCRMLAFWSGKNVAQMDRIFRESDLYREKWDETHDGVQTYGEMTIQKAIDSQDDVYKPPRAKTEVKPKTPNRNNEIIENNGCYYKVTGDKTKQLSNFVIVPGRKMVTEKAGQLQVTLESMNGTKLDATFATRVFSSVRNFKELLNNRFIDFSFMGSDSDLELLKSYLANQKWGEVTGVNVAGIHQCDIGRVFVCADGTLDAQGNPTDAIAMLDVPNLPETKILTKQRIDSDELSYLGYLLTTYNDLLRTIPILGWSAGCFIKEHLASMSIKYPHLALIGEAGSGKSNTMEKVVLPFFSLEKVTAIPEITSYPTLHNTSASNLLPYALDEYKPAKLDSKKTNIIHNMLRVAYDRQIAQRGRTDRTIDDYQHVAPIVIAGEESPSEAAIRERTIEILFAKRDIKNETHRASFLGVEREAESIGDLGYTLLLVALNTTPEECLDWRAEGMEKCSPDLPPRMVNNIGCVYAGLKLLEKLCMTYGLNWDDVFEETLDACADHIQTAVKKFMLDGGTHNKSVLDETFEIMARMRCETYWQLVRNKNGQRELRMRLGELYDYYTRYRREHGIGGEVLSLSDFKKQLRHSEIYMNNGTAKICGETRHCWIVDYDKLAERCDVDGFSEKEMQDEE